MELTKPWSEHKDRYNFVIVGSGYGGSITAARLANATLSKKISICVLERGKQWKAPDFPNTAAGYLDNLRDNNPLGLYELINYRDITVLKGSGLGGTSLVNANVAIRPPAEVFNIDGWPKALTLDALKDYYKLAEYTLNVREHPRAAQLGKVQALERRAVQIGRHAEALKIAVNFEDGPNPQGVFQKKCTDCGDCVTGCNVTAKNTLDMNYLPLAAKGGAHIFTQTKVEWIEKKSNGRWRVHGRRQKSRFLFDYEEFDIEADNVILSAGAVNSTEILLRSSNLRNLSVSPALGTRFGGNGDFFGLSYNGDPAAETLGFGTPPVLPPEPNRPGPSIVAIVRHGNADPLKGFNIEDLSFPSASVRPSQVTFPLVPREDTDSGDTAAENARIDKDRFNQDKYGGALNHTMLYLCMGFDDARGTFEFEKPPFESDGRVTVRWDGAGQQEIFSRINEELRRHTRAQGGSFVANPLWNLPNVRHLITAHPLGGCPMSDDFITGATDQFGRVYKKDGSVHDGLYVADGSLLPSALSVNPFLTISAVSERIAERIVKALNGEAFPAPAPSVGFGGIKALEIVERPEAQLERVFQAAPSLGIEVMVNSGDEPTIDPATKVIRNDTAWKGFFPAGHILNRMSAAIFTGFQKRFFLDGGKVAGITSDTDGRINARNSLEQLDLDKKKGDLEPGRYILLRYLDPPWQGFYDIFKVINQDLLIGRVYLGKYPNGTRMFTFPMTRVYGFNNMKVEDHRRIWDKAAVPTKEELNGVWRMDVISNANQAGGLAYLSFELKPNGRLESRYQLMGLIEGLVMPSFAANHFQLTDFTGFHDEIRKVDRDLLVGKWVIELPAEAAKLPSFGSLGIFHEEKIPGENRPRFGYYYILTRTDLSAPPTSTLLSPLLDAQLPAGVGLAFDEEMDGWYFPNPNGPVQPAPVTRADDLAAIGDRIPHEGKPEGGVPCSFHAHMSAADLNDFIENPDHETKLFGTITFESFEGESPATFPIDTGESYFQYLRVNPATGEAEMRYHLEFDSHHGRRVMFDGRKYMQKDEAGGLRGFQELLEDYTTLYVHVTADGKELGTGYLKFRTFENIAAFRSLAQFLTSFRVTGAGDDALLALRAQMKFAAFTGQFVQREYDPAAATTGNLRDDVHAEVIRGATTPDFFSTETTEALQAILREQPTLGVDKLVNTGAVKIDIAKHRIFRDIFWKGSFAKDSLLGGEERLRAAALGMSASRTGGQFTRGSFWKKFGADGKHQVVNYDQHWLPGDPEVREVEYPNEGRRYLRKGDKIILLTYKNDPYRMVYDTIKVIDDNNATGVMHMGQFPDGIEFATFTMARHNYPLELMSADDARLVAADGGTHTPNSPAEIAGNWQGRLITLAHPTVSLLMNTNPMMIAGSFAADGSSAFTVAGIDAPLPTGDAADLRLVDANTLIGKWDIGPKLGWLTTLQDCVEPNGGKFWIHFVLNRKP